MQVTVIGATGWLGRRLTTRLLAAGHEVVGIGRSREKLAALGIPGRVADCYDLPALRAALSDAKAVASCAANITSPNVLDALPSGIERVVLTGSTRRYTRFPDHIANQLVLAERKLTEKGIPGVIVHPTMVCGEDGEWNIQRVATFIRRFGVVPLPNAGRKLLRPIYTGDLAASLEAALLRPQAIGTPIIAAGRDTVDYATLVKTTATAIGKQVRIVSVPAPLLMAAAPLTRLMPMVPTIKCVACSRTRLFRSTICVAG